MENKKHLNVYTTDPNNEFFEFNSTDNQIQALLNATPNEFVELEDNVFIRPGSIVTFQIVDDNQ